jgi:hypothetical protein
MPAVVLLLELQLPPFRLSPVEAASRLEVHFTQANVTIQGPASCATRNAKGALPRSVPHISVFSLHIVSSIPTAARSLSRVSFRRAASIRRAGGEVGQSAAAALPPRVARHQAAHLLPFQCLFEFQGTFKILTAADSIRSRLLIVVLWMLSCRN